MKGSSSLLLASSTLLSAASGLQLNKRHDPSVVSINFEKKTRDSSASLRKRADDVAEMDVDKHGTNFLYWTNFTIGTPPQNLYAEIDTGSSDLLVLTDEIKTCDKEECIGNIFTIQKSRTFDWIESEDQVSGSFGSGESWSGYYANDTFSFGDIKLDNFQFVATTEYNSTTAGIFSIFGIGLPSGQRAAKKFPSLPYALRNAGEINTAAYSLWLDDDQSGHFLFGGVNKAKYTGPLVTFPIPLTDPSDTVAERLLVVLEGFGTTNDGNSTSIDFYPRPVLLDSGTVMSRLTQDMALHVMTTLDGVITKEYGAMVPCDKDHKYTLDFTFGELTINVPLAYFLTKLSDDVGFDGVSYCKVFYDPKATDIILGDDFLKGAYVVYDYENLEISLAQYNPKGGKDDIHEIVRNVPGATQAKNIPMKFDQYEGTEMGDPTSAPSEIKTVSMTVISSGTATATAIGDPRSTNAGLSIAKPTEAGDAKSSDEDSAAARSLPGNAISAVIFGVITGVLCMW
ncbi:hypothetical protein FPOAC2_09856 [Fusarium poae]|uniref:hypothetical protein n=1 Tax=Fusarium poae TaxID=36050 RepID=UPI001CEA0A39|nr:hypothetical protein FPOAC1_009916 [Fusarium poae]KAG8670497.1 hypothetical protein FPOAC1_009916 [Fusarium poae]